MGPKLRYPEVFLVSFDCFVTKACVRRPGAAASVERRRRERHTLLAGVAGELAGATRLQQASPSSACTFSDNMSGTSMLHDVETTESIYRACYRSEMERET